MKAKFQVKKSGAHKITHDQTDISRNPENIKVGCQREAIKNTM